MTAPGEIGYRLASDRAPHERCVMRWPALAAADDWRGHLGAARDTIAIIARAIAELEPVLMVTDVGEGRAAEMWLREEIEVVELPGYGGWIRDRGPLFVIDEDGHRMGVASIDDGAGEPAAMKLCAHLGIEGVESSIPIEGGALVTDGRGRAIVTERSMRAMAATELARWLGIDEVVLLPAESSAESAAESSGDVTGGHVDKIVTMVDEARVLLQSTALDSAGRARADGHRRCLEDAGFSVDLIEALPHDQVFGETHAVPFVNLYHANGGVIVPLSGSAMDGEVLTQIQTTFPDARVIGVPGRILAYGGGGIRRLTLPVPTGG